MLVSVEASGALERRMRVEVPAQQIDSQVAERLKNVGRTARLEGFRPGKVPAKVIQKRFGPQVRQEDIRELLQASSAEAETRRLGSIGLASMPSASAKRRYSPGCGVKTRGAVISAKLA